MKFFIAIALSIGLSACAMTPEQRDAYAAWAQSYRAPVVQPYQVQPYQGTPTQTHYAQCQQNGAYTYCTGQ